MTHKETITAILECYFTGFKEEIINSACNRILEQESYEELDFVQPHKKIPVNLEVCKMREATQEEREGVERYIDSIAEPCEDVISRQAVKEQMFKYGFTAPDMTVTEFVEDCLATIQPQQKTGHWIKTIGENGITSAVRCSECGFEDNRYMLFRYCPNCGAKMKEGD